MEELLSLKQEVTQLRRAAELNEEDSSGNKTATTHQSRDLVLKRFKEQI